MSSLPFTPEYIAASAIQQLASEGRHPYVLHLDGSPAGIAWFTTTTIRHYDTVWKCPTCSKVWAEYKTLTGDSLPRGIHSIKDRACNLHGIPFIIHPQSTIAGGYLRHPKAVALHDFNLIYQEIHAHD